MLPSDNEREPNPISYLLYLHLSGSAFLVSSTAPNKKYFRVKSVFKTWTICLIHRQ